MRSLRLALVAGVACCALVLWRAGTTPPRSHASTPAADAPSQRVPWTGSRVVGSPDPPHPYVVQRWFRGLDLDCPVHLVAEPGSDRFFVAEYFGTVRAFEDDPDASQLTDVLDLGRAWNVTSLAFHPEYARNGQLYVFVNGPRSDANLAREERRNRILRFTMTDDAPRRCRPETETLVLEWPSAGHDGGDMAFGPDGYLYVAAGDGTVDSDRDDTGQDLSDLPSAILRIDVDAPGGGRAYGIPPDNPFVGRAGARPEIWAFGLRNPWRIGFDPVTGDLWTGDVGQESWEAVYRIERGGNYGWSLVEGSHPFHPHKPQGPGPILPPVAEHPHAEARSVIGGYVYRGTRLADLAGAYVYADHETGKLWALRVEGDDVVEHRELARTGFQISSFGRGRDGELYMLAYSGEVLRLAYSPSRFGALAESEFPRRLSATGLFESVPDHRPAAGLVPYSVNSPLWSDGAAKERFLALPGDDRIRRTRASSWDFEDGTVLVKTFSVELEAGDPTSRTRIETRLLTRQDGNWAGYTYVWSTDQRDAMLVGREGLDRKLLIRDEREPDGLRELAWRYPSRAECMVCHTRLANFVLGVNTLQLNGEHAYPDGDENQLARLDRLGFFERPLEADPAELPRLVDPYDRWESLELRARSYLHANCSNCHVGGGGNSQMDVAFETPPHRTGLFDVAPLHSRFGIEGARLVAPGHPERSIVLARIASPDWGRMPPLASRIVDRRAVELLHLWIAGLEPPPAPPPRGGAREGRARPAGAPAPEDGG